MSELKRTVLYQAHLDAGATMVDFGGWDMPIQYPDGIVAEHLYCRSHCAIFDVSHMGRIDVEGPDMVRFLQHVLSSNVQALDHQSGAVLHHSQSEWLCHRRRVSLSL